MNKKIIIIFLNIDEIKKRYKITIMKDKRFEKHFKKIAIDMF